MKSKLVPRACAAFMLPLPLAAKANIIWPALFLAIRMLSCWAIAIGLVVEAAALKAMFNLSFKRAAKVAFVANIFSTLVGLLIIPFIGFGWEIGPDAFYNNLMNLGTFNPFTWFFTFILACFMNSAIEWQVYKQKFDMNFTGPQFIGLFFANSLSVGVACASFVLYPPSN